MLGISAQMGDVSERRGERMDMSESIRRWDCARQRYLYPVAELTPSLRDSHSCAWGRSEALYVCRSFGTPGTHGSG